MLPLNSSLYFILFFETVSLYSYSWSRTQKSTYLCLLGAAMKGIHYHQQLVFILVCAMVCEELHTCVLRAEAAALHFYEDAKDQKSDPHACSTSPIPTWSPTLWTRSMFVYTMLEIGREVTQTTWAFHLSIPADLGSLPGFSYFLFMCRPWAISSNNSFCTSLV